MKENLGLYHQLRKNSKVYEGNLTFERLQEIRGHIFNKEAKKSLTVNEKALKWVNYSFFEVTKLLNSAPQKPFREVKGKNAIIDKNNNLYSFTKDNPKYKFLCNLTCNLI